VTFTKCCIDSLCAQIVSSTNYASENVDSLAALVAEENAKLGVKPHTIVLTTDQAMSAADALRHGDYQAAELLAKNVLAQSKLQSFSFHPFNAFINSLSQGHDPKLVEGLNAWISHSPESRCLTLSVQSTIRIPLGSFAVPTSAKAVERADNLSQAFKKV
jgi:hypothetical protein